MRGFSTTALVFLLASTISAVGQVLVTPRFATNPGAELNGQLTLRDEGGVVVAVVAVANGACASVRLAPGAYTCEIGVRDRQRRVVDLDVGKSGGALDLPVPGLGHAITGVLMDAEGEPAAAGTEVAVYLRIWAGSREDTHRVRVVCGAGGRWCRGLSAEQQLGMRAVQMSFGPSAARGASWPWIPVSSNATTIDVGRLGASVSEPRGWTFDLAPWRAGMGGSGSQVVVEVHEAGGTSAVRLWRPSLSDDLTLSLRQLGPFIGDGRRVLVRCGQMATFVDPVAGRTVRVAPLVRVSGTQRPPLPEFPLDRPALTVRLVDGPVLIRGEPRAWGRFDLGLLAAGAYTFSTTVEADGVTFTSVLGRANVAPDAGAHDTGVLRVGGWRTLTLPKGRDAEVVCVRRGDQRTAKLCKKLGGGDWLIVVPESWRSASWSVEAGGRNAQQTLRPRDLGAFVSSRPRR